MIRRILLQGALATAIIAALAAVYAQGMIPLVGTPAVAAESD